MKKRILIAVDESTYSRKAMEYAVMMGSMVKDLHYTLFNIQPKISEFLLDDARLDPKAMAALKNAAKKNQDNSRDLLNKSKEIMVKSGAAETHVDTVSQAQSAGTAKTILDFGRQSLCDSILLGKRGLSRLTESFIGSVTNSVLEHADVIPVWAVGGEVTSKKILVAIDGSEGALRAADHVGLMLGDNPDVQITLLHITPRLRDFCKIDFEEEGDDIQEVIIDGDKQCVDSFYIHAKKKFRDAGLRPDQIEIMEVKSTINIGKTIVDEAEKGGFGTIVIGRRGTNNSFFMGSVSRRVLTEASNCAVWLVP